MVTTSNQNTAQPVRPSSDRSYIKSPEALRYLVYTLLSVPLLLARVGNFQGHQLMPPQIFVATSVFLASLSLRDVLAIFAILSFSGNNASSISWRSVPPELLPLLLFAVLPVVSDAEPARSTRANRS